MNRKQIFLYIFISFFLVYIFLGPYGILDIIKLNLERKYLQKKLAAIEANIIILKHKINLFESSIKEKERVAREKLGMIREGEKIIILKED